MTNSVTEQPLNSYTKKEFEGFVSNIAENKASNEEEGDAWLEHFISIVPHPAKSDLIYWPSSGSDSTPKGIVEEIERYCLSNGIPAFKDSPRGRA